MGLRHRGSRGLSRPLVALTLAAAALAPGCASTDSPFGIGPVDLNPFGLNQAELDRLAVFRDNAQTYYDRGHYRQALHSADKALELDDDLRDMQLVRGFCLMKLGQASGDVAMLDESLDVLDGLRGGWFSDDDFRVHLGLGQAHLARALVSEAEIGRLERRSDSALIAAESLALDAADLERARASRAAHLERAETHLRRVLAAENQGDNLYAIIELILVLSSHDDRGTEALGWVDQALALLDESTRATRSQLNNLSKLTPEGRLALERRIETNAQKELLLHDLAATIHFNRGEFEEVVAVLDSLERRGLMTPAQYHNRAIAHERLGHVHAAIADLETCLRRRARVLDFEQDELAPDLLRRLDELKARAVALIDP